MLLKNGKIFYKGKFADLDIEIDDEAGKILHIGNADEILAGNKGGKILNLSRKIMVMFRMKGTQNCTTIFLGI